MKTTGNHNQTRALDWARSQYKKITPQRLEILKVLIASGKPLSASEIHERVMRLHPSLSIDTVYRNLLALTERSIVSQINLQNKGKARFEFMGLDDHHHHHAVCVSCGSIFCIKICNMKVEKPDEDPGFRVLGHAFEVYGTCTACQ